MDKGLFAKLRKKVGIKIEPEAEEYIKAVLGYLLEQLIKSSGELALSRNEEIIENQEIFDAIYEDNDFYHLLRHATIKSLHYKPLNQI